MKMNSYRFDYNQSYLIAEIQIDRCGKESFIIVEDCNWNE